MIQTGDEEVRFETIEVVRVEDGKVRERWACLDDQERFDQLAEEMQAQMAGT